MNILYVSSSPRGEAAYSNRAAQRVLDELRAREPGAEITVRDLAADPLPHIDSAFVAATRGPDGAVTAQQQARLATANELIDELMAADIVVIAAGMINFSIPSTLKSWIDHIAQPGRTFGYSEAGPRGLVTGKHVIVVAASGGHYADKRAYDFQVPYLRHVLGFMGMTDIEVIDVGGTAFGEEAVAKAIEAGAQQVAMRCNAHAAAA